MIRFLLGFHDYVIHIDSDHVSDFSLEDFVYHALIGSIVVLQDEGHYIVVIVSRVGNEGRVFFVRLCHGDLVVTKICVHERQ